ncbi:MAG: hypothetical protein M0027_05460, partial [Candidatus Dormibacteraeota bacterium]|nr:hypothetical protein [Candidatus Dormibacteraeota bacterium]
LRPPHRAPSQERERLLKATRRRQEYRAATTRSGPSSGSTPRPDDPLPRSPAEDGRLEGQ